MIDLHGHLGFVWSAAYSPDGKYIVSGSEDATVRVWDAETIDVDDTCMTSLSTRSDDQVLTWHLQSAGMSTPL